MSRSLQYYSFIVASAAIYLFSAPFIDVAAHAQGIVEHAAVNSTAASLGSAMHKKEITKGLSKIYNRSLSVSSASKTSPSVSGTAPSRGRAAGSRTISTLDQSLSVGHSWRKEHSQTEVKTAIDQSNKNFQLAEEKEKAGKYEEAKHLYYEAIKARAHIWGYSDPAIAKLSIHIGQVEVKQKHPSEARDWFKRGVVALSNHYGSGDYELVPALMQLALLEASQNDHEAASSYYDHVLALQESKFGEQAPQCVPTRISLITQLLAAKDFSEADKLVNKALSIEKQSRGIASQDYAKLDKLSADVRAGRANNSSK